MNDRYLYRAKRTKSGTVGGGRMNEVWKKIFKKYIDDFHAIDKLESDGIIEDEDTCKLKNKLLVDIICTFESEVGE